MRHPVQLRNQTNARLLLIEWDDGSQQTLSHQLLRTSCRCADCGAVRQHGATLAAAGSIQLTELRAVGHYGVQLVFDDGHERGIYPWTFLHTLGDQPTLQP